MLPGVRRGDGRPRCPVDQVDLFAVVGDSDPATVWRKVDGGQPRFLSCGTLDLCNQCQVIPLSALNHILGSRDCNYVTVMCHRKVGEPGMVGLDARQSPGRVFKGPTGQDRPLGNSDSLAPSGKEPDLGECDGCGLLFNRRFRMSRSFLSISQPLHDLLASDRLCLVERGLAAPVPYARIRSCPKKFFDRFELPSPCAEMQRCATLMGSVHIRFRSTSQE